MDDKSAIINRLIKNSAEIITEDEFRERLQSGDQLTHYIGFEISGYVHIGQGIMSALVMKDLTDLGVKCTVWLADWHTWINDKLDGSKETAAAIGEGYFTEAIKASYLAVGGNPADLEFRLATEWYSKDAMKYWETVVTVLNQTTQSRLARSISIMGKEAGGEIEGAKLIYPAMQAADIFYLNVDIAHAAMDQRKAHVIMRDVANHLHPGQSKPIALHHALIEGLTGEGKMSKSKPDSAVFIHDDPADIARKIRKAYCPEKDITNNPILNWTKNLLFWNRAAPFCIERDAKYGGQVEFLTYAELEQAYANGDIHPMDLKNAVTKELTDLLAPVREHFSQPQVAAKKAKLDKLLQKK